MTNSQSLLPMLYARPAHLPATLLARHTLPTHSSCPPTAHPRPNHGPPPGHQWPPAFHPRRPASAHGSTKPSPPNTPPTQPPTHPPNPIQCHRSVTATSFTRTPAYRPHLTYTNDQSLPHSSLASPTSPIVRCAAAQTVPIPLESRGKHAAPPAALKSVYVPASSRSHHVHTRIPHNLILSPSHSNLYHPQPHRL